jgi:hypothetical protein
MHMRNRLTIVMAAVSAIALVTGVAWAAMPTAQVISTNDHLIDVADAGQVLLVNSGAELEIISVDANPGWSHEVEVAVGREVEADFRSADRRIQFNAEYEDGEIRVRVRERSGSTVIENTSTTIAASSASTTAGDSTSTSVADDNTSSTVGDSTSTTIDDSTSTTVDDTTSTTIDDSTSTTMDDAPKGSGSESYNVGGVATVTIAWADGRMSLVSVSLADGWSIDKQDVRSDRVKLEFENGDDEAEFEAKFDDGGTRVEIDLD